MATITQEVGYKAAWMTAQDVYVYQWYALTGKSTESSDRSSVRGIGATEIGVGTTVVGAICGVVGLTGKQKNPGDMEVQIINKTPYSLAPCYFDEVEFDFQEIPRIMAPGDIGCIKGHRDDGFRAGTTHLSLNFLVGNSSESSIKSEIKISLTDDSRWMISLFRIEDNTMYEFNPYTDGELFQYVAYHAEDKSKPSFSFNLQPTRYSSGGKVNLLFLPTYNTPW